ncbi:MAG TPA: energy transducer TonB [Steroidobacteraceae bacterium]|nr:energy transducer TonB [Steroidobacteraceae bacterium]
MIALEHDSQFFTRRTVVLFIIIGLHVFIFWALATGLARKAIEVLAPPIQTDIVEEVVKKNEPPPPPPPEFQKPPVEVPPPEVTIDLPVETAQTTAITNVTTKHVEAPPPAPKAASVKVGPKPGKGFPNTEDYYPAASKRLGEEGAAVVRACVGPNGKLTEDPKLETSSGSARLDEGAINLAKAGSGRYQPATEDGKPITDCFTFRIRFQMTR